MFQHPALRFTALLILPASVSFAQDKRSSADDAPVSSVGPKYPLAVAVEGADVFTVDLDLPGVWISDSTTQRFVTGSNRLRQPMNRPRCVAIHPGGGILVGDSATREIYHIAEKSSQPRGLTGGRVGIPMALAVSLDGKTLYVGDAEKRATFKLPLDGGSVELVARVNARGLSVDDDGNLWAVTPDDTAVVKIVVATGETESVVVGRPFQYPNGLVWAGDHGYVTDGYGKAIWKFTADGETELWHQGDPLIGPVGIAITAKSLLVADPKQSQVYEWDLETKKFKTRL